MRYASGVAAGVGSLLEGSTDPDPMQHGMVTEEERLASRCPNWPGCALAVLFLNCAMRNRGQGGGGSCTHDMECACCGRASWVPAYLS